MRLTRRKLFAGAAAVPLAPALGGTRPPKPATPSSSPETMLPPIDGPALARRMATTLRPAPGERAILFFDPGYYPELAAAVEREFAAAGVDHFLASSFDPPEVVHAADSRGEGARRQDEFVAWLAPVFAKADLFLWLPARELYDDTRLEHLVAGSNVRGIHFHWILGFEGKTAEDIRQLSRLYERTVLDTDYAALSRAQDGLIERLRGKALRLTTPDGTNLRLRVPADAWFHKNDGDLSPTRAKTARCARDRSMELPAGALRFIPDAASVEGRLLVRRGGGADGPVEGLALDFEGGRVRNARAANGEDTWKKWAARGGDFDRVGEIVLGTNPLLASPDPERTYFGYGAGAVRVSLGDDWESGGPVRVPGNKNWWLFLSNATLAADGTFIVREGKLAAG